MYAQTSVIYADLLFLINFSLDFLCLFITSRIINGSRKAIRLISGALLGGIYSFFPYLFYLPPFILTTLHILMAIIICLVSFGKQPLRKFAITSLTFIASSALIGGLVTAIYGMSGKYSNGTYGEISADSFIIICAVSGIFTLLYGIICKRKISTTHAEVRIYANGEKFRGDFLADSGNLVTEPFSALPVIIMSSTALPIPFDNPESNLFPMPTRAIPYATASGSGCFFGFRPDKAEIIIMGKKPREIHAYIAVDTAGNTYSGYDGIIPTSLL